MMTLSEMRRILNEGDLRLTKSLGQNFLHDGNHLRRIVAAAEIEPGEPVLEVGPGLGPLTELLLEKAGRVLAIEKDHRLVVLLAERLGDVGHLTLVHDDALEYFRREERNWTDWKMVANLPYSVASSILVDLAWAARRPQRMVSTLQLEVAHRLAAPPGADDYGILTLLLQLDYLLASWFKIPASCFFPAPDVDSACVVLCRRPAPLLPDSLRDTFRKVVKTGFSQRRKRFLKLLKPNWPGSSAAAIFAELGLPEHIRAEELSLEQFVALSQRLGSGTEG